MEMSAKTGISVKWPVSLLLVIWFRLGSEINRRALTFPSAALEQAWKLWLSCDILSCSQTAAALIFPTAAVIFHTCVAAELPAAPNPSVTDLQSLLKHRGSDVQLMLQQIFFFFPELMEIEEG